MKPDISKYFWSLNKKALKETKSILKNPKHPRFIERLVTVLSRCDKPQEVFSFVAKEDFIKNWPRVNDYWRKTAKAPDFRDWWQTAYEQIVKKDRPKGRSSASLVKIGRMIRESRIKSGMSQDELALRAGMKQPDVSKIEKGKKNITIETLMALCRVLNIDKLSLQK